MFPNSNERVASSDAPPPGRGGLRDALAELSYLDGVAYANSVWTGGPGWDYGATMFHGGSGASRLNTAESYYHCSFTFRVSGTSADAPLTAGIYRDSVNGYYATFSGGSATFFDGTSTTSFSYSNGDLFNISLVKNVLTFTKNGSAVISPTTVDGVYRFFGSLITTQGAGQAVSSWSFQLVPVRWWGLRGGDADLINWSLSKVYARHAGTATNFAYWLAGYTASTLTFSVTKSGSAPLYVGAAPTVDATPESSPTTYMFTFGASTFTIQSGGTSILGATSYTSTDTFVVEYNHDGSGGITFKKNGSSIATYTYGGDLDPMYFYLQSSAPDQLNTFSYVEYTAPPPTVSLWTPVQGDASVWSFTNSSRNVQYIGSNANGAGVTSISFFQTPAASLTLSGGVTDLSFYQVGFSTDPSATSGQGTTVYVDISRDTTTQVSLRRRRGLAPPDLLDERTVAATISSIQYILDPCYNAYFQLTDNTGSKLTLSVAEATTGGSMTDVCYSVFLGTNIANGAFTDVSRGNRPSTWYTVSSIPTTYFNMTRLDSNRVAGSAVGAVATLSSFDQPYTEYVLHSISSNTVALAGLVNHYFYLSGTGSATANATFFGDTLPALQSTPFAVAARSKFFVQASGGYVFAKAVDSNGTLLYTTSYGYVDPGYDSGRQQAANVAIVSGSVDVSSIVFNSDPSMVPDTPSNPYWKSQYLLAWSFSNGTSLSSIIPNPASLVSLSKFVTPTFSLSVGGEYPYAEDYFYAGFSISDTVQFTVSQYYIGLSYDSTGPTYGLNLYSNNTLVNTQTLAASVSGIVLTVDANYVMNISLFQSDGTSAGDFQISNLPNTVSYHAYLKTSVSGFALTNVSRGETPPLSQTWAAVESTTSLNHWVTTQTSLSYLSSNADSNPTLYSVASYAPKSYLSVSLAMPTDSATFVGLVANPAQGIKAGQSFYVFRREAGSNVFFNVCGTLHTTGLSGNDLHSYEVQLSGGLVQAKVTTSLGVTWDYSVSDAITDPLYAYFRPGQPTYATFPSISFTSNPLLPPPTPAAPFYNTGYTGHPPITDFSWNSEVTILQRVTCNEVEPGTLVRTLGYPVIGDPDSTSYPYYLAFSLSMIQESSFARAGITTMSQGPIQADFAGMNDDGILWNINRNGADYDVGLVRMDNQIGYTYISPVVTVSAAAAFYLELSSQPSNPGSAGVTGVYARVVNPNGSNVINISSTTNVPTYSAGELVYPFFQMNVSGITFSSISYNNTTVSLAQPVIVPENLSYGWGDVGDPATWEFLSNANEYLSISHTTSTLETITTSNALQGANSTFINLSTGDVPVSNVYTSNFEFGLARTRAITDGSNYSMRFSNDLMAAGNVYVQIYEGSTYLGDLGGVSIPTSNLGSMEVRASDIGGALYVVFSVGGGTYLSNHNTGTTYASHHAYIRSDSSNYIGDYRFSSV